MSDAERLLDAQTLEVKVGSKPVCVVLDEDEISWTTSSGAGKKSLLLLDIVRVSVDRELRSFTVVAWRLRGGLRALTNKVTGTFSREVKKVRFTFGDGAANEEAALDWVERVRVASGLERSGVPERRCWAAVINPISGSGSTLAFYNKTLAPALAAAGLEMVLMETMHENHAMRIGASLDLDRFDGCLVMGGDGIVQEVVNGLMRHADRVRARRLPISVVPAGSQNALSATAGIRDVYMPVITTRKGAAQPLDVIRMSEPRYEHAGATANDPTKDSGGGGDDVVYGLVAINYGFISDIVAGTSRMRSTFGRARYFAGALPAIFRRTSYIASIDCTPVRPDGQRHNWNSLCDLQFWRPCAVCEDGGYFEVPQGAARREHRQRKNKGRADEAERADGVRSMPSRLQFEGKVTAVMAGSVVAKATNMGEQAAMFPYAHMNDGLVDVIVVHECSRLHLLKFILRVVWDGRSHLQMSGVEYVKAERVTLRKGNAGLPFSLDGELISGGASGWTIEALQNECQMMLPSPALQHLQSLSRKRPCLGNLREWAARLMPGGERDGRRRPHHVQTV